MFVTKASSFTAESWVLHNSCVRLSPCSFGPILLPPSSTACLLNYRSSCHDTAYFHHAQRHKKTGEALTDENGNPLPLTSHTLAPVPVAIGGAGLPANVIFSKDLPNAGLGAYPACTCC